MRWCWVVVAMLGGACGGRDEVVPDASPDVRDASPDAWPDAGPMVALGPVEAFDEVLPGAALGQVIPVGRVAWNGSEFLVSSGVTIDWVRADGTLRDITIPSLPGTIACHASGECIIVNAFLDGVRVVRIATDGTELDPAPIFLDMPTDRAALVGATQAGFVIVTATILGLKETRIGLSGPPIDATPIVLLSTVFALQRNYADMDCDDAGCTIAFVDSPDFMTFQVHALRVDSDGTASTPVDIPGWVAVDGLACSSGRCVVIQQDPTGPGPIEGIFVDALGVTQGSAFPIESLDDSNFELDVAADTTGFTIAAIHGATMADSHGEVRVIHLAGDGSVDASTDVLPTQYDETFTEVGVTCTPSTCMAVASVDGIMQRARLDNGAPLDTAPYHLPTANAQTQVTTASDGSGHLVSWYDIGVDAGAPTRALRAAAWSSTGWSAPATVPLATGRMAAWPGTGYLFYGAEPGVLRLARVSSSGALIDATAQSRTIPAGGTVYDLACRPDGCLGRYRTTSGQYGGFAIDANLVVTPLGPAFATESLTPYGAGFARVYVVGDHIELQVVSADGDLTETINVTPDATLPAQPRLLLRALGDGLAVVWRSSTDAWARTVSSSSALGPIATIPLPGPDYSLGVVASGPGALFTWSYPSVHRTIYGLQTDANLSPLSAPFEIATVDSSGSPFESLSYDGTTALIAWSHLDRDPALMTERLAVRSITAH